MSSTPPEHGEQPPAFDKPPLASTGEASGTTPRRRVIIGESQGGNEAVAPALTPYLGPPNGSRRITPPIVIVAIIGILVVGIVVATYMLPRGSSTGQSLSATTDATGQPTAKATDGPANPTSTPPATETAQAERPAAGLGTPMPDEGNAHVDEGTIIIYKNYPPTSGPHYPRTADPGFYEQPVPEGYFVHSMEHGAIVLYYNPDLPDVTKQQLKDLMTMLPFDGSGKPRLVIVPYTNMQTPLAIAAWRRLLLMKDYNFDEIRTFYQEWVDKGPENVP